MKKDPILNWFIYLVTLAFGGYLIINGPVLTYQSGLLGGFFAFLVCLKLWCVYNRWTSFQWRYQDREVMLCLKDGTTVRGVVAKMDHPRILGGHILLIEAERYQSEGEGAKVEMIEGPDATIQVEESMVEEPCSMREPRDSRAAVH